jgi:hypothetical protein
LDILLIKLLRQRMFSIGWKMNWLANPSCDRIVHRGLLRRMFATISHGFIVKA